MGQRAARLAGWGLWFGLTLVGGVASAQIPAPSGNLYGTVADEQDQPIPGVAVAARGPGASQGTTTDRHGDFHFLNLSPGDYVVTLERTGLETVRREVTVALGKNAVLSITMAVAGAAEAVTVSGDSRKIETGETFNREELDTIPTTRDPWAILRQVPCVQLANVNVDGKASAVQSVFVGKGAHVDQNTYNLDGVAITGPGGETPLYFDFDSMQAISVVTGGSDPGISTPGVTLNLVTHRGTNDFRGSGRAFYFFPGNWDYGLEAGGPLWKDHLWLWAARAGNNIQGQTVLLPDGEPFRPEIDLQQWNAKLNAQIVPSNELSLFYLHFDKVWDGRQAGPSFSFPSSWKQTTPTSIYRVEDSQVLSEKLFVSLYGSYLKNNFTLAPEGGVTQQADLVAVADFDYVWQNSFLFHNEQKPQHQAGLTASGFFDTGKLSHELKFGFGYKHVVGDSLSVWPGDQLFGNEPSGLAAVTRAGRLKVEWNYYDVYAGDTIQAGNLTVNLGLRFDHQQAKKLPSAVPANPVFPELLPAVQYGGDSGYAITWRLVQPRVGATYALGQQRKTLVRASYSKFTDQLGEGINSVNPLSPAYLYYPWSDTNGNHRVEPDEVDLSQLQRWSNVDPGNPGSVVSLNQISSNLKPAETNEFMVGVGRQFSWDFSASITYTHRSAKNQYFPGFPDGAQPIVGVTRDDYQYAGNAVGTATASDGFTLSFNEPYYGLATCPAPCAGIVIENRPDYSMRYDGVELQVTKELSHGWGMRVGFAYNDWTQTVGPGAIVNPNNLRGGVNRSGAVIEPVFSVGRSAGSFINSKWQFNLNGRVQLPLGIIAAANFFGRQGFPIGYFLRVVTIDARGPDTIPLQIGRVDAKRNPDVYDLDLHVEKLFRIGKAFTINPILDCFNVANRRTVLQRTGVVGTYDATLDPPSFKKAGAFDAPAEQMTGRTFRAGVRISF